MAEMRPDYRYIARVTRVVDGDTFDAEVDLGFHVIVKTRFRMANIDAPETYGVKRDTVEYQQGVVAKDWLKARIENREVFIVSSRAGKFGRWLATVYLDGTDINFEMIDLGLAVAY